MKFTLSWLKEYLEIKESADSICQKLTDIGLEVESVDNKAKILEPFTVAKIIKANPHPDSDKLQVCEVDVGAKENLQIICGAKNARTGLKVIYAPIGCIIPASQLKIKQSKIRGVDSFGMLCSAAELGLGLDGEGIIEIDDKFEIGTKLIDVYGLNDVVIEVNITPNRGDCLGVYGIARDLASTGIGTLKKLETPNVKSNFESRVQAKISTDLCPYFSGYYIKNITNKESPDWLKEKLKAVGVNSISAVVDITNYVMLSLNQPLHAYDASKLEGNLTIRKAIKNEEFTSLKDDTYILQGEELLICDDQKIVGLAGIIGGNSTSTSLETKDIFLEAAYFNPGSIANSGRKLKILSDARYRFERNIDLGGVKKALDTAANLIISICGGEVSKLVEAGSCDLKLNQIDFDLAKIEKLLNTKIPTEKVEEILSNLGFTVKNSGNDKLQVTVPSFRHDIKITEDLVEEIIRIYGYDKINSEAISSASFGLIKNQFCLNDLRTKLCSIGLDEIISWSFIDSKIASHFSKINDKLIVANAISEEMNYMRPSLIPGLILTVKKNQARGANSLAFFETGKVFLDTEIKGQIEMVAALRVGKNKNKNHYKDERDFDVMDIKKDLFDTLEIFGVSAKSVQIYQNDANLPSYYHPYRSAILKIGNNIIGQFGEIHPILNKKLAVKGRINVFELLIEKLPIKKDKQQKKPFIKSDFQPVSRDFAFIFDKKLPVANLIKMVKNSNQELINEVNIFDIYQGENIDKDKKSIAFNVEIIPKSKTLTSEEIDEVSNQIINIVHGQLGGVLRDK